jgi:hypothetical protein
MLLWTGRVHLTEITGKEEKILVEKTTEERPYGRQSEAGG